MVRARRQAGVLVGLTILAVASVASPASAASVVGQTGNTGGGCLGSGYTFVQDTVAGPPAYAMPSAGVITSWSHQAGSGNHTMRMKVYRETIVPDEFFVVGESAVEQLAPNGLRTFATRVAVDAGDLLGLSVVSGTGSSACLFVTAAVTDRALQASGDPPIGTTLTGPYNPASNRRVNVAVTLEADADRDGFGDETQDGCPSDVARQDDCLAPQTTITKDAPKQTDKSKVKFKFVSDEAGSTFECKVDKKPFKPCQSPRTIKHLDEGKHKFKVRAVDAAGNVDASPAKDKFKVVP